MNQPTFRLSIYTAISGKQPYTNWIDSLKDRIGVGAIKTNLDRLSFGHLTNTRFVGDGVWELKVNSGPGYRVYYLRDGEFFVLLFGGTKSSQERDIDLAKSYSKDYWRTI